MLMLGDRRRSADGCAGAAGSTDTRWFLLLCQIATPIGFIAVIAGWAVTEVGRQPWTVYGLLRTAQSVSPSLTGIDVADLAARLHGGLSLHVSLGRASDVARSCAKVRASPKSPIRPSRPDGPRRRSWPARIVGGGQEP